MDIVIIEDLKIISQFLKDDFNNETNNSLSVSILETLEQVRNFDFSKTKYLVSDLYLGTAIYDTLLELYQIKKKHPSLKISVYTQSCDIPHLEPLLCLIQASHLFDKRFTTNIAEAVLNEPCQQFCASTAALEKARNLLALGENNQFILQAIADGHSPSTIAVEVQKSKSAISQALTKIETTIGARRNLLKLFSR